jgi:hypothetical protein
MPFPFEVPFEEVQSDLESYIDATLILWSRRS